MYLNLISLIRCHECDKLISVSGSKKLSEVINLINLMKKSKLEKDKDKDKMNEQPIQGCLSEADAQYDSYVTGEATGY